ncbi:MAG: MFS transporter [Corynebacterium sp.]|uniref:MFS transporter n=1 Tax=Corynebacterium sp. TaxID=1720 RepID=UPI0026DC1E47|nr:MFS transporter [Corynebacterium sp.]MDO4762174.1 MFS transporter [Corynebacterium sp.]
MAEDCKQKRAWIWVALAVFTVAWGGNHYTPILIVYRAEHFFSAFFIDMMLVAYAVGVAIGLLLAGPASDRYGRKTVLLPTPFFAACASLLIAFGQHSSTLMTTGRLCSGLAVGIAMTAGGAWIKELSTAAYDPFAVATSGAKRAAMALTAGFALGPAAAGFTAQFLPFEGQLPYLLHIVLSLLITPFMLALPETRVSSHRHEKGGVKKDLSIPSLKNPRFYGVVVPMAPWVFGAGFTAYAIIPPHVAHLTSYPVAFTALIALVTLGSGFGIQQFGPTIAAASRRRGPIAAMGSAVVGMGLAMAVVIYPSIILTVLCCVALGFAYGLCAYVGLAESQKIARPADMAGLVGIFYCLTYVGMLFPALLTKLSSVFSYPVMLGFGACVALATLGLVSVTAKRY